MLISQQVARFGFALIPEIVTPFECDRLAAKVTSSTSASGGTRSLLGQSWCRSLASQLRQHITLAPLFPLNFVAVQCTYFEKSSSRNWLVPVHQDLSIPVAKRVEHPDLSGWSKKDGALFVQAPTDLLEQLLAVRVHLDRCTAVDGPLRVVPCSHALGRVEANDAVAARLSDPEFVCVAERGSVLAMRPLLLHASSKASGTSARRVLHFLFGPRDLPFGLNWQEAV
jgi:hypothetical protein